MLSNKEQQLVNTLLADGYDCYVDGNGWHCDDDCFETFELFFEFAKKLVD